MSLLHDSQANFARFTPAALKSFWHPGGGVPIFDGDSEGGYAFFTGAFPEKYHPPHQKSLNSP